MKIIIIAALKLTLSIFNNCECMNMRNEQVTRNVTQTGNMNLGREHVPSSITTPLLLPHL